MATTIITKNGSGAPTADDLSVGELAVDLTNKRLYSKNSSSEVIELGVNTASSLDVTGTVTADGLTVDTDTLYVDATNNRVGIGTSSPTGPLHVAGSDSTVPIKIDNTGTGGNTWRIWSTNDAASDGGGKLGFYNEDTATRAMTLDSSGQVGIGTSSPDYNFHVSGSGDTIAAVTAGASSVAGLNLGNSTNKADGGIRYDNSADALIFRASNAERMRIDSSGNVGIGVSSLVTGSTRRVLQVSTGTDGGQIAFADSTTEAANPRIFATNKSDLKLASANSGASTIQFITGASPAERMRITSAGQTQVVGYDAMTLGFPAIAGGASRSGIKPTVTGAGAGQLQFLVGGDNTTEATTIAAMMDASGNLLVGGTTAFENGATTINSSGLVYASRSGNKSGHFNREGFDGEIVNFSKNGTSVGSIGTANGDSITIGNSTGNLILYAATVAPASTSAGGASNGVVDLGTSARRFKDLYLSGGAYLGGAVAANLLDDYEEGTSSATSVIGITATTNTVSGRYTKIGNTVIEHFQLTISGKSGGSGNPYLGLSFTPSGNQGVSLMQGGSIGKDTVIGSSLAYMGIYGSGANVYANTLSGSYIGQASWTDGQLCFTVIYETN